MKEAQLVTAKDLPAINRILRKGNRVILVPTKGGKRGWEIERAEIDFPGQPEDAN